MKAIKYNKVYAVDETSKSEYLAKGFDIYDDNGKLLERSPSSTVSRKDYDELQKKYDKLKAENDELKAGAKKTAKGKSGGVS